MTTLFADDFRGRVVLVIESAYDGSPQAAYQLLRLAVSVFGRGRVPVLEDGS